MTSAEEVAPRYATYPGLRGKVAFVSGGSTGLGAEFVASLAAQAVRVGFVDVDEAGAKTLVGRVREQCHPEPLFVPADVRDVGALQAAVRHVGDVSGRSPCWSTTPRTTSATTAPTWTRRTGTTRSR